MKITGKTDLPAIISSKVLNFSADADSDFLQKPILRKQASRRSRNSGGGVRLKRDGFPVAGKKGSRPETPLLRWKFDEAKEEGDVEVESEKQPDSGRKNERKVRKGREVTTLSVRKLAAGLWRLQLPDVRVNGGGELCNVPKNNGFAFQMQPAIDHTGIHSPARHNRKSSEYQMKEVPQSPNSVTGSRNKVLHKLELTFHFSNSAMEGATKWDPGSWKESEDVKQIHGESKRLNEHVGFVSMVSVLESELDQARARIHDLENERRASKKKLEQFLKKVNEERSTWKRREHEKIRSVIDDIKHELNRERKNRRRMEIMNSKLVNELADTKLSAKRYMIAYEKERKARELIEEVCNELAKEIGDDKAEVEALKRESMKMREVVDDERKMLQMAEVWREERVQMKLVDAKVTLEDKFSQMNTVIADLESFLNSKSTNLDLERMKRAEALKQSVSLVNIQEIGEFKYEPPNPDDGFSVFEEEMIAKEIEPAYFDRNGDVEEDEDDEEESGWETASHLEDQGSSYPSEWSSPGSGSNPDKWPRGVTEKNNLKAKLLQARMESQKIQLRHVLKQKI